MNNNVMIIDDNEYIRESLEILFQTEGIRILPAEGGIQCISYLEAGFKGVLLMDVMMPHMDGWDTIRQIVARGLYDGNIILMLTAQCEPAENMEGIQSYITDYVIKPFNPFDLLSKVKYYASLLDSESETNSFSSGVSG
ncbi:MAG: histidine kinase [Geobacteraceae bacterium GWB2_52_12]|nr:MAG: histidine kinase [Geobacteraceae bacterium GWB2_52_12]